MTEIAALVVIVAITVLFAWARPAWKVRGARRSSRARLPYVAAVRLNGEHVEVDG